MRAMILLILSFLSKVMGFGSTKELAEKFYWSFFFSLPYSSLEDRKQYRDLFLNLCELHYQSEHTEIVTVNLDLKSQLFFSILHGDFIRS